MDCVVGDLDDTVVDFWILDVKGTGLTYYGIRRVFIPWPRRTWDLNRTLKLVGKKGTRGQWFRDWRIKLELSNHCLWIMVKTPPLSVKQAGLNGFFYF